MIPVPGGVRIWIAIGRTEHAPRHARSGLQVQQVVKRNPRAGDLFVLRGRAGDLVKIPWHDGVGLSLYAKLGAFWLTAGPTPPR